MTARELSGAILNFAFQGKLVPQDPKDEDASSILHRIRVEKEQLIKAGVIKTKSQASHITQEEIPYEIPNNWTWTRISEICDVNPRNQIPDDTEVSFIPMQYIEAGFVNIFRKDISRWGNVKKGFTHLKEGDVVFAKITPCFQNRKSAILSELKNGYGAGTTELHILRPFSKHIFTQYLLWFVKNDLFIQEGIKNFTGTVGQQRVSTVYISQYLIPIPPLPEQKRIVAKIEELLPLVEKYDESEKRLLELNKKFPNALRKAILQQAVQGKLAEQDPNDEPASELLKKIKAEKARLIKEGKIKKEKPLLPICEEEIPFDIPDNWTWVRLSEICEVNPRNQISDDAEVSFIPMKCIEAGFINEFRQEYANWGAVKKNFTHLKEGDIVFAKITPCFQNRKSAILLGLKNGYGAGTTELHVLRPFSKYIFAQYLLWFVKNDIFIQGGVRNFTGTVGQQRVNTEYISRYMFPVPPLAEQKRIVDRIEELLLVCDNLQ
jgi:type I restriction enzyme S subunit